MRSIATDNQTRAGQVPSAADALADHLEQIAVGADGLTRLRDLGRSEQPLRITSKLVEETIDDRTGIPGHAPLDTQVAWVRDLFAQIDVDSREGKAVAVWKAATDQGVSRSDPRSGWLRWAGAGCVLNRLGTAKSEIPLPRRERSREWLKVALVECARCHQVAERTSPVQRHCRECRRAIKAVRSREAVRRSRSKS